MSTLIEGIEELPAKDSRVQWYSGRANLLGDEAVRVMGDSVGEGIIDFWFIEIEFVYRLISIRSKRLKLLSYECMCSKKEFLTGGIEE